MNPTTTITVDGARPWDFEVADETRREIVADINGLRRAANRAVGTVDAIAHRFERRSAERRMADGVLNQVGILRVLAYGWRPLCTASFEAIAEGVEAVEGDADLDRLTVKESAYSENYFRAEVHGRVYVMHREVCCPDCADKFVVVMEAEA